MLLLIDALFNTAFCCKRQSSMKKDFFSIFILTIMLFERPHLLTILITFIRRRKNNYETLETT